MSPTQIVEVYLNAENQIVAKDSQGKWRVYDPNTKRLTFFATPPPRGAKPQKPPEPEEVEVARETDPTVVHIDEQVHQLVEQMGHKEENEQLRQKVIELEGENTVKDTMIAIRDATIESLNEAIRKLNQQFEAEKNTPRADPAEIERLKREIAKLTADLNAKPTPTSAPSAREMFYERWWSERNTRTGQRKLGAAALVVLLLLFFLFGGVRFWFWSPSLPTNVAVLQQQVHGLQAERDTAVAAKSIAESDRDAALAAQKKAEGERDAAKSAQATAESRQRDAESKATAAETKAKAAEDSLAKASDDLANAKDAQKKAEAEMEKLKSASSTPTPTPTLTPSATLIPPPAPDAVVNLPPQSGADRIYGREEHVPQSTQRFRCIYSGPGALPVGPDGFNSWCASRH